MQGTSRPVRLGGRHQVCVEGRAGRAVPPSQGPLQQRVRPQSGHVPGGAQGRALLPQGLRAVSGGGRPGRHPQEGPRAEAQGAARLRQAFSERVSERAGGVMFANKRICVFSFDKLYYK